MKHTIITVSPKTRPSAGLNAALGMAVFTPGSKGWNEK